MIILLHQSDVAAQKNSRNGPNRSVFPKKIARRGSKKSLPRRTAHAGAGQVGGADLAGHDRGQRFEVVPVVLERDLLGPQLVRISP